MGEGRIKFDNFPRSLAPDMPDVWSDSLESNITPDVIDLCEPNMASVWPWDNERLTWP